MIAAHDPPPTGAPARLAGAVRGFGAGVGEVVREVVRSRAGWLFATIWLSSLLVLVASGNGFPHSALLLGAVYLALSLVTAVVTRPQIADPARAGRRRLWLQLAIIAAFVALTAWRGLVFHSVAVPASEIPIWTPLVDALDRLGGDWFGADNYVTNPVTYLVLPLVALLLAGANVRGLGFGPGRRTGRVVLLWCAVPAAYLAALAASGQLALGQLLGRFASNFMQNGVFEEFLFRGALQSRLRALWTPAWALVVQALVFGAWHLGLGFTNTGHAGVLPALASGIAHQAVIGLALGVIFERTRNLLAPSAVHLVGNSLG